MDRTRRGGVRRPRVGADFVLFLGIGAYSVFDLALIQYAISGSLCLLFLIVQAVRGGHIPAARDWSVALFLGVIGYLAYFLSLTGAALYAGPVIAPAFLGLVPVVLAIAGNLRQRTVSWRKLAVPLIMTAAGLLLVNGSSLERANTGELRSIAIGIPLAILAVSLWTWFGLLNQSALARRPDMRAGVWTALILMARLWECSSFCPSGWRSACFSFHDSDFIGRSLLRSLSVPPAARYLSTSAARWPGQWHPNVCRWCSRPK